MATPAKKQTQTPRSQQNSNTKTTTKKSKDGIIKSTNTRQKPNSPNTRKKETEPKKIKPLTYWDIDVWYAATVLLIGGLIGNLLGKYVTEEFLSGISIGILSFIIPMIVSFLFSTYIKLQFRDEEKTVNSTPYDFLFSVAIVIALAVLCRELIGEGWIVMTVFAIIGMIVSYLGLLNRILELVKNSSKTKDPQN